MFIKMLLVTVINNGIECNGIGIVTGQAGETQISDHWNRE